MPQKLTEADLLEILPEIDLIEDSAMRTGVAEIWIEIAAEMAWNHLNDIPKNTAAEADRRLTDHIHGVTETAIAICEIAKRQHGQSFDRDLLVAACLLHDASKAIELEPDPEKRGNGQPLPGRRSALGLSIQHAVYAAHKVFEKKLPVELANLVVSHTHTSNIRPSTWEGAALFYADFADTDASLAAVGEKLHVGHLHLGS